MIYKDNISILTENFKGLDKDTRFLKQILKEIKQVSFYDLNRIFIFSGKLFGFKCTYWLDGIILKSSVNKCKLNCDEEIYLDRKSNISEGLRFFLNSRINLKNTYKNDFIFLKLINLLNSPIYLPNSLNSSLSLLDVYLFNDFEISDLNNLSKPFVFNKSEDLNNVKFFYNHVLQQKNSLPGVNINKPLLDHDLLNLFHFFESNELSYYQFDDVHYVLDGKYKKEIKYFLHLGAFDKITQFLSLFNINCFKLVSNFKDVKLIVIDPIEFYKKIEKFSN